MGTNQITSMIERGDSHEDSHDLKSLFEHKTLKKELREEREGVKNL